MTHREAIEKVVEIERGFPIEKIRYRGYCVWFLIRLELFRSLVHKDYKMNKSSYISSYRNVGLKKLLSNTFWTFKSFYISIKENTFYAINRKRNVKLPPKCEFIL